MVPCGLHLTKTKKILILFTAYFLLSALVHIFDRSQLTWQSLDNPSIKDIILPNGFEITYYEMTPGPFTDFQSFISLPMFAFILYMVIRFSRAGNQKAARPLLISLILFWIGVFNDTLVSSGVYDFIYIIEYSFIAIILLMAVSLALDIATVTDSLRKSVKTIEIQSRELEEAYEATLQDWAKALELRDQETEGHSHRVVDLTLKIARDLDFCEEELEAIQSGVLLHDIGKMAVPSHILGKPGPLNEDEWDIMRQHPTHAYELLEPIPYLHSAIDIPYCHHERWDGNGYPRGLKGDEIPLAARIFTIVDVWDALRSNRPYRKAWPKGKVYKYIIENAGSLFDPELVDLFFLNLEK